MRALRIACFILALGQSYLTATEPVRLVFDTDIGNDVDDVLALGMIHSLQSRGHCELLAVTVTKDNAKAGRVYRRNQHILRSARHTDRSCAGRRDAPGRQVSETCRCQG